MGRLISLDWRVREGRMGRGVGKDRKATVERKAKHQGERKTTVAMRCLQILCDRIF